MLKQHGATLRRLVRTLGFLSDKQQLRQSSCCRFTPGQHHGVDVVHTGPRVWILPFTALVLARFEASESTDDTNLALGTEILCPYAGNRLALGEI